MIFTLGYQNLTRQRLQEEMKRLSSALVDVRYVPYSSNPFWTQPQLQEVFFKDYYHIKDFGNVNYKGGPFQILNMEKGIETFSSIKEKYENIFLMCACKKLTKCHRFLVAEEISQKFSLEYKEFDNDFQEK